MDNATPERYSVEKGYCSDSSDNSMSTHRIIDNPSDSHFDQMEMMKIEMTFGGGKQDNIVVLWGDDATTLATVYIV